MTDSLAWLVAPTLAAARIWALLRVQASWAALLGARWQLIAAALAVALAGLAASQGRLPAWTSVDPLGLPEFVVVLVFELALGSVIGLAAALPGQALVGAARTSEHGLELREPSSLAPLLIAGSLAAALALGLHRPLLTGLLASFTWFPIAQPHEWLPSADQLTWLVGQLTSITALALALASPVLLTRTMIELGLGSLARTGSEPEPLLAVLVPGLRLTAGLVALGAAWSAYPEAFARGL